MAAATGSRRPRGRGLPVKHEQPEARMRMRTIGPSIITLEAMIIVLVLLQLLITMNVKADDKKITDSGNNNHNHNEQHPPRVNSYEPAETTPTTVREPITSNANNKDEDATQDQALPRPAVGLSGASNFKIQIGAATKNTDDSTHKSRATRPIATPPSGGATSARRSPKKRGASQKWSRHLSGGSSASAAGSTSTATATSTSPQSFEKTVAGGVSSAEGADERVAGRRSLFGSDEIQMQQQQQQQQEQHQAENPNEFVFTNQTGFVLHCPMARELARIIERADREAAATTQSQQQSSNNNKQNSLAIRVSSKQSQHQMEELGGISANRLIEQLDDGGIRIHWEKWDSSGEAIESIVYATQNGGVNSQQEPPMSHHFLSSSSSSGSGASSTAGAANSAPTGALLRHVRASDGALVFEPFKQSDFRPEVHVSSYRCVASTKSRSASLMSNEFRIRALLSDGSSPALAPGSGPQLPEVMDAIVIVGGGAQFKCQLPDYEQSQYQVLDWIEYPGEEVLSFETTTKQHASILFKSTTTTTTANSNNMRYFVSPKNGDLHILNVDLSLNYRSFKCRVKNKLTGDILVSPNRAKLVVTESHSAVSPRLLLERAQTSVYHEGQLGFLSCGGNGGSLLGAGGAGNGGASSLWPELRWLRRLPSGELQPLDRMPGMVQLGSLLLINQLHRNHSGVYLCQARNSNSESASGGGSGGIEQELLVRVPLRSRLTSSASVLELGKSLALDCAVSGFPVQQIEFRHNRRLIKTIGGQLASSLSQSRYRGVGGGHVRFKSAAATATGGPGSSSSSASNSASGSSYFVLDGAETRTQRNQPSGGSESDDLSSGEQRLAANQQRSHSAQLPQQLADWAPQDFAATAPDDEASSSAPESRSGAASSSNSGAAVLNHVIVILLEPEHTGAYQCLAYNQFESTVSSVYIEVLDEPPKFKDTFKAQVYEQKDDISLQCSARANPLPEITWSLDEEPLPETGRNHFGDFVTKDNLVVSYVNISGAEVVDTGEYKCIADNGLAQISHRAQISVSGPLQVKRGANSNLTVLASSTLRLRCPVAGYPISEIQWHHNGRRLPANHRQRIFDNGTLEVEHMERGQDDQGLYTCIASSSGQPNPNAIGPASSSSSSNSNGPDSPGTPTSSPTSNTNNNKQQQSTQAQGSVFVTIKARPSIAPFVISNSLREGERATIGCTVSSGDLPIEISWFRNGRPIWLLTDEQQQQQQQDNKINQLSSSSKSLALGLSNNNNNEQRQVPNAGNPNVASLYANANEQLSLAGGQLSNSLGDSIQAAPLSGVRVIGVSEYSSTLLFESLSVSHSGNYSCVARNDAGTASHQSQMIVQVAPKWILEPVDSSVTRGQSLSIDCSASGYPMPRVIWTKANGQLNSNSNFGLNANLEVKSQQLGSWKSIVSSPHLQVFENGSLNVIDARDSDQGHYMCQASNGVGPGLSKVIKVTVNVAAQFSSHHTVQFVVRGEQVQLKCQLRGDWPLTLHWFRGKNRLEAVNPQEASSSPSSSSSNQLQQQQQSSSQVASVLMMPSSSSPSSWSLNQLKSNLRMGISISDQLNGLLLANSIASGVAASDSSSGLMMSLDLSGSSGNNQAATSTGSVGGGLLVTRYSFANTEQLLPTPGGQSSILSTSGGESSLETRQLGTNRQLSAQLSSLLTINQAERSDTNTYKCLGANHFGLDERTIQLIVQDSPERVEELSIHEVHSRTIVIGWIAPHDGNSPITNYNIQYKQVASATNNQLGSVSVLGSQPSDAAVGSNQLDAGSWFNYTLNVVGGGSASSQTNAFLFNVSSSQATPMAGTSGQIGSKGQLQLQQNAQNAGPNSRALFKVAINGLKPLTRYKFRVQAENKLGPAPVSRAIETNTLDEAPGAAPTKVKAVAQSSSSLLVSWSRPPEKEQLAGFVHGYYVSYKLADLSGMGVSNVPDLAPQKQQQATPMPNHNQRGASNDPTSALPFFKTVHQDEKQSKFEALITGLKRSTKYLVSVQAFNGRGTGPSSEPVLVRTLEMDPPRQVKLRLRQATNCSLELEWRPLSSSALLIDSSHIKQQTPSLLLNNNNPTSQFDASQLHAPNDGPLSSMANPSLSSSPDDLLVTGQDQATDQVDYYSLFYQHTATPESSSPTLSATNERGSRWQELRIPGSSSSYRLDNLRCGSKYQFYMLGVNRIGRGEQSDILEAKTVGGIPLLPDSQSCFEVINSTCFLIRLDAWQDNGCPIEQFIIKYRDDSSSNNARGNWINLAQIHMENPLHHNNVKNQQEIASNQAAVGSISNQTTPLNRHRRWLAQDQDTLSMSNTDQDASYLLDYQGATSSAADASSLDHLMLMDYNDLTPESSLLPLTTSTKEALKNLTGADQEPVFSFLSNSMMPALEESASDAGSTTTTRPSSSFNSNGLWTSSSSEEGQPEANNKPTHNQARTSSHSINSPKSLYRSQLESSNSLKSRSQIQRDTSNTDHDPPPIDSTSTTTTTNPHGHENLRLVRLCNLNANTFYTVQITAINGVGPMEAQLQLWTSPEGIEYDAVNKRNVVITNGFGSLTNNRIMSSSSRHSSSRYESSRGHSDTYQHPLVPSLDQWPVLVPLFLGLLLIATIIIVSFLLRRAQINSNINGSQFGGNSSNSSSQSTTTTTTTTATAGHNILSSLAAQQCQNYLHPLGSLNHQSSSLINGSNHQSSHHPFLETAPSSSISEAAATIAPSGCTASEMGDSNHFASTEATYSLLPQKLSQGIDRGPSKSLQPTAEEPAYGIVGYSSAHSPPPSSVILNHNTLAHHHHHLPHHQHQHPSESQSVPTNHAQTIFISNPGIQDSMTLPHNSSSRPRNVFLCQSGTLNTNTLKGTNQLHENLADNGISQYYGFLTQTAALQQQQQQQQRAVYNAQHHHQQQRSFCGQQNHSINECLVSSPQASGVSPHTKLITNNNNQHVVNASSDKNYSILPNNGNQIHLHSPSETTCDLQLQNQHHHQQQESHNNQTNGTMVKQAQHYDSCFMSLVDEVARASDSLRTNNTVLMQQQQQLQQNSNGSPSVISNSNTNSDSSSGQLISSAAATKVQLVESQCNQPDCFSLHQF